MKTTVETEATNMMLYAMLWIAPGPVCAQTKAAIAARNTSTRIPPLPTSARCQRLRNDHDDVASTYGTGVKINSITPMV